MVLSLPRFFLALRFGANANQCKMEMTATGLRLENRGVRQLSPIAANVVANLNAASVMHIGNNP